MRILVVFSHPSGESFGAALCAAAVEAFKAAGHEVRLRDLYRMGFDPVLSPEEWSDYLARPEANETRQEEHIADLRWAEGLAVIYPTWFYGPPAILKGWLERTWLPGVAFDIPRFKGDRPRRRLGNIRLFVGITTSGSPWWWLRVIRDPGRSLFTRGLRILFAPGCRTVWLQLHNMNSATARDRARFLGRVSARLARL